LRFARQAIECSRTEADPRYLGRAQAALAPWWNLADAPAELLVLRATIRQSQHDFTTALADLDLALKQAPNNAQAWLTRATVSSVLGDFTGARRACLPLAQLAPGLVALTAAANISSLNGNAERACSSLRDALAAASGANKSERVWALTVLSETAARLGNQNEAEKLFKDALRLAPNDAYLQGAYADLLLEQNRNGKVIELLRDARSDGLLLRLTLAESKLRPKPRSLDEHIANLAARFEEGQRRGDFVHLREEARFELELRRSPQKALPLALQNWRVQHEPADARLLLECAVAADAPSAAAPVLDFVHTTHLEDHQIKQLAKRFAQ
jgi:tetratricopeptide (TPR) repeat protein